MGDKVNLTNSTYNLAELNRSIDNSFNYFTEEASPEDTDTVQELFRLYNKLYLSVVCIIRCIKIISYLQYKMYKNSKFHVL